MSDIDVSDRPVRADIPDELVWRHSFAQFTTELDDPYHAVVRLEDKPPLIWGVELGTGEIGGWLVTDPEVMNEVFMDPERFSAHRPAMLADLLGVDVKLTPLDFDPPEHASYRKVLQPLFTPRAVAALDDKIRATCDTLIAGLAGRTSGDFVADMAVPFPSYVFLDMMGISQTMLGQFLTWQKTFLAPDPMGKVASARAIFAYFEQFVAEQRVETTSPVMQVILSGEHEGRPLEDLEILGMLYVLYLAGLDTVTNALGWTMRHLATDSALQDRLRSDPKAIPGAVEEFIRAFPVARTFRTATRDMEFHGTPVKAGDRLHLPTMLAGRHSRAHENPHAVDIARRSRHMSFGTGNHTCLGMHLARREIAILLETFLDAFDDIRITEGDAYRFETHANFGVTYLPITWNPRQARK